MRIKAGDSVHVTTCGGKFNGKVVKVDREGLFHVRGPNILTVISEQFIGKGHLKVEVRENQCPNCEQQDCCLRER